MRWLKKNKAQSALDLKIEALLQEVESCDYDSPEYEDALERLTDLMEVKKLDVARKREPISPNTVISALTSLGGIALILFWEHAHVVTSKAMSFIWKPKA